MTESGAYRSNGDCALLSRVPLRDELTIAIKTIHWLRIGS